MKKRSQVRWSARARDDLISIGRYIAAENPRSARLWVERLRLGANDAAQSPLAGRRIPETDRKDLRETLLGSYRIVYKVVKTCIEVVNVFEGHRLLADDLEFGKDQED
jgi:plasmid stabilization system protein ParE